MVKKMGDTLSSSRVFRNLSRLKHTNKKVLLVVFLLLVVLVSAVFFLAKASREQTVSQVPTELNAALRGKVKEAQDLSRTGSFDSAKSALDASISQAKTPEEKAFLRVAYAELSVNQGKYDEAISYAREANSHKETADAYGMIGYAARQKQDWKLAADSYAKAAELSPSAENDTLVSAKSDYKNAEAEARSNL